MGALIRLQGNPVKVVSADVNDTEVQVDGWGHYSQANIKITSGTFQFNVGSIVDSNDQPSYTTTDTVPPIALGGDKGTLHFKATTVGATFNLSFVF